MIRRQCQTLDCNCARCMRRCHESSKHDSDMQRPSPRGVLRCYDTCLPCLLAYCELASSLFVRHPLHCLYPQTNCADRVASWIVSPLTHALAFRPTRPLSFRPTRPLSFSLSRPLSFPLSRPLSFSLSRPLSFPLSHAISFSLSRPLSLPPTASHPHIHAQYVHTIVTVYSLVHRSSSSSAIPSTFSCSPVYSTVSSPTFSPRHSVRIPPLGYEESHRSKGHVVVLHMTDSLHSPPWPGYLLRRTLVPFSVLISSSIEPFVKVLNASQAILSEQHKYKLWMCIDLYGPAAIYGDIFTTVICQPIEKLNSSTQKNKRGSST